jgi:hypothetical protein
LTGLSIFQITSPGPLVPGNCQPMWANFQMDWHRNGGGRCIDHQL